MREEEFLRFLVNDSKIVSKEKAVKSRVSKARKVENEFNISLDEIVRNDEKMYYILKKIKEELIDSNGSIQNAVRKYYLFINQRKFPSINQYERKRKVQ